MGIQKARVLTKILAHGNIEMKSKAQEKAKRAKAKVKEKEVAVEETFKAEELPGIQTTARPDDSKAQAKGLPAQPRAEEQTRSLAINTR